MSKKSQDLSGEPVPVHEDFIKLFSELNADSKKVERDWEDAQLELRGRIESLQGEFAQDLMEIKERIADLERRYAPHIKEIDEEVGPKIRKLRREELRLKLDFEEAWDNLFLYHEEYRGRSIQFDPDDELFRFNPEGERASDQLVKDLINQLRKAGSIGGFEIDVRGIDVPDEDDEEDEEV